MQKQLIANQINFLKRILDITNIKLSCCSNCEKPFLYKAEDHIIVCPHCLKLNNQIYLNDLFDIKDL